MSKIGVWTPEQDIQKKETAPKDASKTKSKSAERNFWDDCIKQKRGLTFRLVDTTELEGKLIAYDNYFLLIETEGGKPRLIHKGGLLWVEASCKN